MRSVEIGCLTVVHFLFVLFFSSFGGLSFIVQSGDEALFSFWGGEYIVRGGKRGLVRTVMMGDPMDLRLMVWFEFSVLFFYYVCSAGFARDQISSSCPSVRVGLRIYQSTYDGERPTTGLPSDAMVFVDGCAAGKFSGGFFGIGLGRLEDAFATGAILWSGLFSFGVMSLGYTTLERLSIICGKRVNFQSPFLNNN